MARVRRRQSLSFRAMRNRIVKRIREVDLQLISLSIKKGRTLSGQEEMARLEHELIVRHQQMDKLEAMMFDDLYHVRYA